MDWLAISYWTKITSIIRSSIKYEEIDVAVTIEEGTWAIKQMVGKVQRLF